MPIEPQPDAGRKTSRRVPVLLPLPLDRAFDYRVPDDLDPAPGDVVVVPLNRREEVGVVWDGEPDASVPDRKLKPISAILDTPPMGRTLRQFVDWVAAYTLSPPGEVMSMALRVIRQPTAPVVGWRRVIPPPTDIRLTPARQRVLDVLSTI